MAELNISVNADAITLDDLIMFDDWKNGQVNPRQMVEFLKRIVVSDVPVGSLRVSQMNELMAAIGKAVEAMHSPKG